jgi:peptide/nickel transport system permease protein
MDVVALVVFTLFVLYVVAFSLFPTTDPTTAAGPPFQPPSLEYWAGTDAVGRDIWSRIIAGAGLSLLAALVIISVSIVVGSLAGTLAGALGGWVDSVFMRTTDLFLALPAPVLAIAVAGALGRSFEVTLIAVTVVWWPLYARLVRGETRALMVRPHVEAARLSGSSRASVFVRHVLPGTFPPVIVAASLDIGLVVLTLAGLSFLGLGSPEPSPELGAMAAQGLNYLLTRWWVPVMPALMVFVLAYLANLAGDALRDVMNKG